MATRPSPSSARRRQSRPPARRSPPRPPVAELAPPPSRPVATGRRVPAVSIEGVPAGLRLRSGAVLAAPALIVVAGVVLLAIGPLGAGIALVVLGLAIGLAGSAIGAPARLAGRVGGRPVEPGRDDRLINLAEGLCVASGLALPSIRVLDDEAANTLLLATSRRRAVLVVTAGLLARLERVELEGVLAHELAHLRRGDASLAASATRAAGLLALWSASAAIVVLRLAGREREARADLAAASLTRYPPGLGAALDKLADAPTRPGSLDAVTARLTAPLWCVPLAEGVPRHALPGALTVSERAAMLHEL